MKVSVITPCYNAAAFVRRAIDSVLAQTEPVHEMVVVDDGSTDGSDAIVASYGGKVRLIRQANQGASGARNRAAEDATGDWLAFLDADDALTPDNIAVKKEVVEANPAVKVVYGAARLVRGDNVVGQTTAFPAEKLWPALRYRSPIVPSATMVARDAFLEVGGFDRSLPVAEDWDLWHKLLEAYSPSAFFGIDRIVCNYNLTEGGLSADPMRLFNTKLGLVETRLLRGTTALERRVWRRKILAFFYLDAAIALRERGDARAFGFVTKSLLLWPFASEVLPARRYKVFLSMAKGKVTGRSAPAAA